MKYSKLQLPQNYVEINTNEMHSIEGGKCRVVKTKMSIDKRLVSVPLNGLGWWYTGKSTNAIIGKMASVIARVIKMPGLSDKIGYLIGGYGGSFFNIGDHIANGLDRMDGKKDGRITYWKTSTVC